MLKFDSPINFFFPKDLGTACDNWATVRCIVSPISSTDDVWVRWKPSSSSIWSGQLRMKKREVAPNTNQFKVWAKIINLIPAKNYSFQVYLKTPAGEIPSSIQNLFSAPTYPPLPDPSLYFGQYICNELFEGDPNNYYLILNKFYKYQINDESFLDSAQRALVSDTIIQSFLNGGTQSINHLFAISQAGYPTEYYFEFQPYLENGFIFREACKIVPNTGNQNLPICPFNLSMAVQEDPEILEDIDIGDQTVFYR